MPGTWDVISIRRTTQVSSPTVVQDVMIIGVLTNPSRVYFERSIPYKDWIANPVGVGLYAEPPADNIETLIGNGTAVGASYIEDLNSAGLVEGFVQLILQVESGNPNRPGPFQTTVDIPMDVMSQANLGGGGPISAAIGQAIAALQATAGV